MNRPRHKTKRFFDKKLTEEEIVCRGQNPEHAISPGNESADEEPQVYFVKKATLPNAMGRREFVANSLFAGSAITMALGLTSSCEEYNIPWSVYKSLHAIVLAHDEAVTSISFGPEGKLLVSESSNGYIKIWSIPSGQLLNTLEIETPGCDHVFSLSPDGKMLASSDTDSPTGHRIIKLLSVPDGQLISTFREYSCVNAISFSPDGKILASGCDYGASLWKVAKDKFNQNSIGPINAVSFSPDGTIFATGNLDGEVRILSIPLCEPLITLQGTGSVISIGFSPSEKILVSLEHPSLLCFWALSDGKLIESFHEFGGGLNNARISMCCSTDGKFLATGNYNGSIELWDISSRKVLNTLLGHSGPVVTMCFSPDGELLASGSKDKTVRIWKIPKGEEFATLNAPCVCDTVCTCHTVSTDNDRNVCTCNNVTTCTCNQVCSCNAVCSCDSVCSCNSEGGGGTYWYPN